MKYLQVKHCSNSNTVIIPIGTSSIYYIFGEYQQKNKHSAFSVTVLNGSALLLQYTTYHVSP